MHLYDEGEKEGQASFLVPKRSIIFISASPRHKKAERQRQQAISDKSFSKLLQELKRPVKFRKEKIRVFLCDKSHGNSLRLKRLKDKLNERLKKPKRL